MKQEPKIFIVDKPMRLDKFCANVTFLSRNKIKKLINEKAVKVNSQIIEKANYKLKENDQVFLIEKKINETSANALKSNNIPLNIVYEEQDYLIINKQNNLVVHPGAGNFDNTLVNGLINYFGLDFLKTFPNNPRPGIVHRIDKQTTGLLLIVKNLKAMEYFSKQIENHLVKRNYLAIVDGHLPSKILHIELPISRSVQNRKKMKISNLNGKKAKTHVFELEKTKHHSLVKCSLETGRTHQIRVHLAEVKNPIHNDPVYNKSEDNYGQFLHAYQLEFQDLKGNHKKFTCPLPEEFQKKWNSLKTNC